MANIKCGDANNPAGPYLKANGTPCNNPVVGNTWRCYMHGGATPAAKMKAEMAMALLRVPAIELLYKVMETESKTIDQFLEDTCAVCGYPKGDVEEKEALIKSCLSATKAAQTVLDRTGMGPSATLTVKQSDGDFDLRVLTPDEKARMIALFAQFRALKEEVRRRILIGSTSALPTVTVEDVTEE